MEKTLIPYVEGAIYSVANEFTIVCSNCNEIKIKMSIVSFNKIHLVCPICGHEEKV